MKILMAILSWFGMVLSGMFGGQKNKAARRFGLPALAVGEAIGYDGFQWRDLAFLLLIPVLIMGYGVDSVLGAWLGHTEWLIRFVYAMLLSIPFAFYGLLRWAIAATGLVIAFQIHAGSLGHVSWFGDILIEDIARYGTLAAMVLMCLFWKRKPR